MGASLRHPCRCNAQRRIKYSSVCISVKFGHGRRIAITLVDEGGEFGDVLVIGAGDDDVINGIGDQIGVQ